jgi:hypothetical protein
MTPNTHPLPVKYLEVEDKFPPWGDYVSCEDELSEKNSGKAGCMDGGPVPIMCAHTCCRLGFPTCAALGDYKKNNDYSGDSPSEAGDGDSDGDGDFTEVTQTHVKTETTTNADGSTETTTVTQKVHKLVNSATVKSEANAEITKTVDSSLYFVDNPSASTATPGCATMQKVSHVDVKNGGKKLWESTFCLDQDANIAAAPATVFIYHEWNFAPSAKDRLLASASAFGYECGVAACGGANGCGKNDEHIEGMEGQGPQQGSKYNHYNDAANHVVSTGTCHASVESLVGAGTDAACPCQNDFDEDPAKARDLGWPEFTTCDAAKVSFADVCTTDAEFAKGCKKACMQCGSRNDGVNDYENTGMVTFPPQDGVSAAGLAAAASNAEGSEGELYTDMVNYLHAGDFEDGDGISGLVSNMNPPATGYDSWQEVDGMRFTLQVDLDKDQKRASAGSSGAYRRLLRDRKKTKSRRADGISSAGVWNAEPSWAEEWETDHTTQKNLPDATSGHQTSQPGGATQSASSQTGTALPSFQMCVGRDGTKQTYFTKDGIEARMTYRSSCFKMYDGDLANGKQPHTEGHLDFDVDIRLAPCENPNAHDCLQKLCHQSTITSTPGSDPVCDGAADDGWVPMSVTQPYFGTESHSVSPESTVGRLLTAPPTTYFELSFSAQMTASNGMEPFLSLGASRRCYLQYNLTADGHRYMLFPRCSIANPWMDLHNMPLGGQHEMSNAQVSTTMPTLDDYDSFGSLEPPSDCTGTCCDDYMTGALAKPWDDFVSCEEEKPYCAENALVRNGCQRTCGTCTVPCTSGCCNKYDIGALTKPYDGFQSCADELAGEPTACEYYGDGCELSCNRCVPDDYVNPNEFFDGSNGGFFDASGGGFDS